MRSKQRRASRRQFARGGAGLVFAFALASTGAACGETDEPAAPPAAGKAGQAGSGATAGDAGKPSAGGAGGTTSGRGGASTAGQGAAGASTVAGRGGAGAAGRGGNAGRGGSAGAGMSSAGESNNAGESNAGAPGGSDTRCSDASLLWRSANKTNYTSYPDPGSEECIKYNGCTWAGQFAACSGKKPESWVAAHDIVAAFPDFESLELHDLCLRKGDKVLVVTVLDTCGDSDCSGCCTENQGSADQLIDIESYTNERWGVPDGPIEWADLGPTTGGGCD